MDMNSVLDGAKAQAGMPTSMPPQAPQATAQDAGGQMPPPELLNQLAQEASQLDPMILGLIVFHALTQAHLPLNTQGLNTLGQ